ncbi:hypothetical protein A2348_02745 [Candidatus Uhrbacteria bacterium RIFOXYB12_FULL_58_10]|uniref:Uncharacterized protein n=1 Tax=Candidatus Uhrbacteria bacterium RIFOXYB2_FULL_57_15 TaxID=1802422 RepID=A0A1F7W6Q1_9BACT|nr:MAG: hypothetical protein A2348_02745 [Candidatus Uhrbacteria bacterium RIFOXYB12_FULL_58_10]OGL98471.1 MAG: hypothetical protein A2304_02145 [Candidatus Uhrbacteria bacterium RIFOXYB2_FULL_57_15]OGL99214.1 MAG: hypothetical protein A2501_03390 [Candidatus Uhrbacteria bacterium RIFOXYC12_FULL_57_11]
MILRKFTALFAVAFLIAAPVAASARVDIDTNEKNFARATSSWTQSGEADVLSDGRVRLESTKKRDGYVSTDVDVSRSHNTDYALFISYTRAEKPYANLASGAENIAGLPYLYGYFLNDDGDVNEYFTNSYMRHDVQDGTYWQVTYGYMVVPKDTEAIRLFLKQASRNGTDADGRDAWFYKPGLYFVEGKNEVRSIVNAYEDELANVAKEFGNRVSEASDVEDNTDYPVGTLLKCNGESDVYSMNSNHTLKRFPDEETFYAWGHSFADVRTISCSKLDDYRVSGTWTYDRASYLVKFRGMPAVFTLDNGRYLRLIPDEYTARKMFGSHWTDKIREYSSGKMGDYSYGVPHKSLR